MNKAPINILLVEDNPGDVRILQAALQETTVPQFEVVGVTHLYEALNCLADEQFDVILLDLSLPDAAGLKALLQVHQKAPNIPIIILTVSDDETLGLKAVQAGAQDYLIKGRLEGSLIVRAIRYAIERKRAEERLRRSEARFRTIVAHDTDSIIIVDKQGIIQFVNRAAETLFGRPSEDLVGQAFGFPVVENERVELEIVSDRKGVILAQMGVAAIEWEGEPKYLASLRDITERKRTEEELRSSEERFRRVISSISDHIYATRITADGDYKHLYLSPHVEALTGYPYEKFMADWHFWSATVIHPDDRAAAIVHRRALAQGLDGEIEYRLVRADGEVIWVRDSARVESEETSPNGSARVIYGVVSNITDRKQLEEQLRQSQKMEAVGLLAGGIAHDFNNWLTVIIGYSQLLAGQFGQQDPMHQYVREINEAAERAVSLTRQLLIFSRKQILQPKVLDLNHIVADLERLVRRLIGEDVDMITVLEPDLAPIKADPGQIEQVIMNLVVNARDAMPDGGELTIETANVFLDEAYAQQHVDVRPGSYIMLVVGDTGSGMDRRTKSRIFEPFFTTKDQGKGTGLGLATVHGIISQSGGHIRVESQPGRGTVFKLYFRQVDTTVEAMEQDQLSVEADGGSETILLVEDEDTVRKLAIRILREKGYKLLTASHGVEALRICEGYQGSIDLLLTDMVMPGGLSGHQLANHVLARRSDIKILYMSGYIKQADMVMNPDRTFIQKPFTPDNLAHKVRQALEVSPPN